MNTFFVVLLCLLMLGKDMRQMVAERGDLGTGVVNEDTWVLIVVSNACLSDDVVLSVSKSPVEDKVSLFFSVFLNAALQHCQLDW